MFFSSYSKVVIKIYCAFKIEKIVNHKNFVIFSFFWSRYIRVTYSKYFQNDIWEGAISSVPQKSTSWFFFLIFLYIFNLCNQSLYLKYVSANLFFFNFDFCKKKNKFYLILKLNVLFPWVWGVFATFVLNLRRSREFDFFSC